jgi:hypothetical protein
MYNKIHEQRVDTPKNYYISDTFEEAKFIGM